MNLNIKNEYDTLKKVILSLVDDEYLDEHKELLSILNKYNVEVLFSNKIDNAKYQMFTRDPFIVIKDKILLCRMKESIRQLEEHSIDDILSKIDDDKKIYVPDGVYIEGGDVIVHNGTLFVGQKGNRTNEEGLEFLKEIFPEYKIVSLDMINPSKYIPLVHLDCLFNPISNDTAIVYKEGFTLKSFKLIESMFTNLVLVDSREQEELACNVFSLGSKTLIVQERHKRIIDILVNLGFKVETMKHYESVNETGYTRCLTCPLERIKD